MGEPLRQILLRSYRARNGSEAGAEAELNAMLEIARRNNERDDLTGALICTEATFTQVLEGPCAAVEATFERICRDLSHRRVQLLEFIDTNERVFTGRPMALIQGGQPFHTSAPFISADGQMALNQEAMRFALELMRSQLTDRGT